MISTLIIHPFGSSDAGHQSDVARENRDDDTLHHYAAQNAPRTSAERFADAELMGALLDGDEHNVGDTHHAAQQCEKTDDPKGVTEDTDGGILLLGALGGVVDPKSILVGG